MDDLISRQDAIDACEKNLVDEVSLPDGLYNQGVKNCLTRLRRLPSAQQEPQWIPCSERLPKPYEYCLWTTTDGRVVYHHCDGLFSNYIAWMPLPECYKGEKHETK